MYLVNKIQQQYLLLMKILIFGASGSGTTTLGKEIGKNTEFIHLDADDYYWKKTPPYMEKIPLVTRNKSLKTDFDNNEHVVVTGSLISWGQEWTSLFDLAIFIYLESGIRMERLRKREFERYGDKLLSDQITKQNSDAFMKWASQYDNPDFNGRSLRRHDDWIKRLSCEVLRMNGAIPLNENLNQVISEVEKLRHKKT